MIDNEYAIALQEAYANAEYGEVILHTLEIIHPGILDENGQNTSIRLVSDYGGIIGEVDNQPVFGHNLGLEDTAPLNPSETVPFISCAFDFALPGHEEGRLPEINIAIDNVTQEVSQHLDNAVSQRQAMEVIYREYLADNKAAPQFIMEGFNIKRVTSTVLRVTATASFLDMIRKGFPSQEYTPELFPGLLQ